MREQSSRLRVYLDQSRNREPGWRGRWERELFDERNTVLRLLGYYQGMLDELIAIIGHDRAVRLIGAHDDLEDHIATMSAEVQP